MNFRRNLFGTALLLALAGSLLALPADQKTRVRDLPEKHRDWLDLVSYIIHPKEKDVFLGLVDDKERDVFIEAFWRQRDPTPGTPENEYRDEHIERVRDADKKFSRYSSRKGWMTDQGRIYIILGPPASIERFEGDTEIYPCEVWSYYGDPDLGLPTHFSLVFYVRGHVGEPRLYNPASDGPAALMVKSNDMDPFDYEAQYERLYENSPTLALVSLSLIPGEIPYGYHPSPQNNVILANITEFPLKKISPTYATHFLDYKGFVSTDYLVNYIESDARVDLIKDPQLGITFLHFSVAPTKTISMDYYAPKDQYFCNIDLDVSLKSGDTMVFQYTRNHPLYFSEDELANVRNNGLAIEDSFPVIEGTYRMTILVRNSVGKEFSIYTRDIQVAPETDGPGINGPFLGFRVDRHPRTSHIPFKILESKLAVDIKNTYSSKDTIILAFNLIGLSEELRSRGAARIFVKGLREKDPSEKTYTIRLNTYPAGRIVNILHSIPAGDLSPDYYDLRLALEDGAGATLDSRTAQFIVSPQAAVPHPVATARSFNLENSFVYFYALAQQYDKAGNADRAGEFYRRAFALNAGYVPGIVEYANFLLKTGAFDRTLQLVEGLAARLGEDKRIRFDYHLIRGKAFLSLLRYQEAIDEFLEGNKIYNSDTGLLNSLGFSYYKTGEKQKAIEALNASLRLNPAQEDVKKLVREIEKEIPCQASPLSFGLI